MLTPGGHVAPHPARPWETRMKGGLGSRVKLREGEACNGNGSRGWSERGQVMLNGDEPEGAQLFRQTPDT